MRARNIKPSLFKNELLAVADPLHTLIFEGLWCMADREGRLEDRPARIHIEVNPGRAYNTTEASLAWLTEQGFIHRYAAQGMRLIQVVNFAKHQHPHHREPPSTLPPPEAEAPCKTLEPEADDLCELYAQGSSPGLARGQTGAAPLLQPPSARLIPDSGFSDSGYRIPDTRGPEARPPSTKHDKPIPTIGLPAGVNFEALKTWEAYIRLKGKAVNDLSRPALARKLVAFGDVAAQAAVVEHSMASQYSTLVAPQRERMNGTGSKQPYRRKSADELEAELRAKGVDPYAAS